MLPSWIRLYTHRSGNNITPEDFISYAFEDHVPKRWKLELKDMLESPSLYSESLPMPGALEGIQRIKDKGHRVVYATSCAPSQEDSKRIWLQRYNLLPSQEPGYSFKDFISVTDKANLLRADILVDDRPSNVLEFEHGIGILFCSAWNKDIDYDCPKALSWNDLPIVIEDALLRDALEKTTASSYACN